jgi:polyphenol oxidase
MSGRLSVSGHASMSGGHESKRGGHGSIQWLVPDWPVPPPVRALSTWRGGGVSGPPFESLNLGDHVEDAPAAVAANRRALRTAAALPSEPAWLAQVHGTRVLDLDSSDPTGPADASVTRQAGRVCAILTADCLPVLLASASGECVAAAHAGWRGLAAGVIEAAVAAMGCAPRELMAWLGPAIGPRHFEIGPEVRDELLAQDPHAHAAFAPNERGRFLADLYSLARRRLAGVGVERVCGGGACTYAQSARYFSHRRDGRTGRQATLIWLEGAPNR